MSELVEKYYRSTTEAEGKLFKPGQLVWAPGYYLPTSNITIELMDYDPKDERKNRYTILKNPPENVTFNHKPVQELGLEHDEEFLVIKAKRRKFIILSSAPIPSEITRNRLHEKGAACVPLYSFQDSDTPEFCSRVKKLEYPWWVYMPDMKSHNIKEGFARLERLQVISEYIMEPTQTALTDDALFLVSEWLRYYLTGNIDAVFLEDRQQMMSN